MINTINTDVHTAHAALEAALTAHQVIPARLPLAQLPLAQAHLGGRNVGQLSQRRVGVVDDGQDRGR